MDLILPVFQVKSPLVPAEFQVRVEGDEGESCVSLCVWGLAQIIPKGKGIQGEESLLRG